MGILSIQLYSSKIISRTYTLPTGERGGCGVSFSGPSLLMDMEPNSSCFDSTWSVASVECAGFQLLMIATEMENACKDEI